MDKSNSEILSDKLDEIDKNILILSKYFTDTDTEITKDIFQENVQMVQLQTINAVARGIQLILQKLEELQ